MSQRDPTVQKYVDAVRAYMRDYPELNRLIEGVENSDTVIIDALADAVEDWNITPPLIKKVSIGTHPAPRLLIKKAAMSALESATLLQMRNQLAYSDGQGTSVSTSDKAPSYQAQMRLILQQYEASKQKYKIALNIEGGWDSGVASEASLTGGGYIL